MPNNHLKIEIDDQWESSLSRTFHELLGDRDEYMKVFYWSNKNNDLEEVKKFKESLKTNSILNIKYCLAKMTHKYDEDSKNELRTFKDIEIQNILKFKRHLISVTDENDSEVEMIDGTKNIKAKFSYTTGNCLQDPSVPELLSFYPYGDSIQYVLNSVSNNLIDETIKPLFKGEVREITGILGRYGQMPIRLKLLNEYEYEQSCKDWTTGVPKGEPIILVDIPDFQGYFASEKECIPSLKENYPEWIRTVKASTEQQDILIERIKPCYFDAFYYCLNQLVKIARSNNQDSEEEIDESNTKEEEIEPIPWANVVILLTLLETLEPEPIDKYFPDLFIDKTLDLYKYFSIVRNIKDWFEKSVNSSDEEQLERIWCIGTNQFYDYCRYEKIEDFKKEINWNYIIELINMAFNNSLSQEETDRMITWELGSEIEELEESQKKNIEKPEEINENIKDNLENYKEIAASRVNDENSEYFKSIIDQTKIRVENMHKELGSEWKGSEPNEIEEWQYILAAGLLDVILNEYVNDGKEAAKRKLAIYLNEAKIFKKYDQNLVLEYLLKAITFESFIGFLSQEFEEEKDDNEMEDNNIKALNIANEIITNAEEISAKLSNEDKLALMKERFKILMKQSFETYLNESNSDPKEGKNEEKENNKDIDKESDKELTNDQISKIQAQVGGEECFSKLMNWAQDNLSEEEINNYDSIVEEGNDELIIENLKEINSKYEKITGTKLRDSIEPEEDNAAYYLRKSFELLGQSGKEIEVIKFANKSLEIEENSAAYYYLGFAKSDINKNSEALKDLDKAIKIDSDDARYFYVRGNIRGNLNNKKGAIEDYKKVLEIQPQHINALGNLALAQKDLGQFQEAIITLNKAIDLDPMHSNNYRMRGNIKYAIKKFEDALNDFNKALNIPSEIADEKAWREGVHADAYFNRAFAKIELEDLKGACLDFKKASDLGNHNATNSFEYYCKNEPKDITHMPIKSRILFIKFLAGLAVTAILFFVFGNLIAPKKDKDSNQSISSLPYKNESISLKKNF